MKLCKFCGNNMHLDERNMLQKGKYLESYDCGACGSVYDVTVNSKGYVFKEHWFNPNKNNFKHFKDLLDQLVDCFECSKEEKENIKRRIDGVSDYVDIIQIMSSTNLTPNEKQIELLKNYCLKSFEENPNIGTKTKKILSEIISRREDGIKIYFYVIKYVCTHNVSD